MGTSYCADFITITVKPVGSANLLRTPRGGYRRGGRRKVARAATKSSFKEIMNDRKRQLGTRKAPGTRRAMFPTEREVFLAKMLLCVLDALGEQCVFEAELYNSIKAIAEPLVRDDDASS